MIRNQFNFLWVIEFPLLGFDREQNRWYSSHHPFTAPVTEDIPLLKTDPKKVRGQHYDIVVNGVELGGGSIRIHQPDVQKTIFEELLPFRRKKRNSVSATCSKRSDTALRRTAASRWASTGSSRFSAARRASATSSRSRKLRKVFA